MMTSSTWFYFLLVLRVHFTRNTFTAFSRISFTFTQVQSKCTDYSSVLWDTAHVVTT